MTAREAVDAGQDQQQKEEGQQVKEHIDFFAAFDGQEYAVFCCFLGFAVPGEASGDLYQADHKHFQPERDQIKLSTAREKIDRVLAEQGELGQADDKHQSHTDQLRKKDGFFHGAVDVFHLA